METKRREPRPKQYDEQVINIGTIEPIIPNIKPSNINGNLILRLDAPTSLIIWISLFLEKIVILIVFVMCFIAYGFISNGDYLMLICTEILLLIGLLIILKVVMHDIFQVEIKMPEKLLGLIGCIDLLIIILLNLI